jgi:hypothetical protein
MNFQRKPIPYDYVAEGWIAVVTAFVVMAKYL